MRDYHLSHAPAAGRAVPIETYHAKLIVADDVLAYVGSAKLLNSSEALSPSKPDYWWKELRQFKWRGWWMPCFVSRGRCEPQHKQASVPPRRIGYVASCDYWKGLGKMSKQSMREESERLVREAMAKKSVTVKQGDTRIETRCGKCGAPNRVSAAKGADRPSFTCKECGHKQKTL